LGNPRLGRRRQAPLPPAAHLSADPMNIFANASLPRLGLLALSTLLITILSPTWGLLPLPTRADSGRWLQVERVAGEVTVLTPTRRAARVGDRLAAIGQGMSTGPQASANLQIDGSIGTVAVAQNTDMTIQQLSVLPNGARVTVLDVPRGQVRLQVRSFTNPNSRLELHSPSGVAAVRGTEFGISVDGTGKTSIATAEGQVVATAQNASVALDPGLVSTIEPGEPPTAPRRLDRELDIRWETQARQGNRLRVACYVDPANTLLIDGQEVIISRTGYFEGTLPLVSTGRAVTFTVRNPLGEARPHPVYPWQL